MNILLLSQFFSDTKGGGEYVFSLIAKLLAEKGHKIWVITNLIKNENYEFDENIKIEFVEPVLEYKGGLPVSFYENLRYSFGAVLKGLSIVKNEKIDIIHSNNFAPALAGSIISFFTRKPHITTVHDIFSLCGKDYWKQWGKQNDVSTLSVKLAPFFEKMILRLQHKAIHTVSEASKDDLKKFGSKKPIYVIPNSIEEVNNKNLNVVNTQFVFIGRLVFYKNLEVVIKALRIVKKIHPEVMLLIAGDGPHRKNLEKIVQKLELSNNIKFLGFVSSKEKSRLLSASQALVFPSLCEGFGLVILEAFSHGRPVLVSKIRPLSDIVSDRDNGFVISPHNEEEWAERMNDIIENPEEANKMGQDGRRLLKSDYQSDIMIEKVLQMYNEIKD